jgi:Tol biopolymer transport system component
MKKLYALALAAFVLPWLQLLPAAPPPEPGLVKAVNLAMNTADDEDDPFVDKAGLTLYYASNAKGKWDIMFSRRPKPSAAWGKGEVLQDYIQTEGDDRSVFATADSRFPQFLYYASKGGKDGKNFDLYVAIKQGKDKAFSEPRAITTVDTEDADELHPWLTADGKELYFTRKTKAGWRVFVAKRPSTTGAMGFGEPTLVEDIPPDFHHATLTPDGNKMYLQGFLDGGRWGLFVALRNGKGWNKPEPLTMLNDPAAPTGDRSPALSPDGFRLYFASDRPNSKGGLDLWVVETYLLRKR